MAELSPTTNLPPGLAGFVRPVDERLGRSIAIRRTSLRLLRMQVRVHDAQYVVWSRSAMQFIMMNTLCAKPARARSSSGQWHDPGA